MRIAELKVNQIENPLGFQLDTLSFSYKIKDSVGSFQKAGRIIIGEDREFQYILYDSGVSEDISPICTVINIKLKPRQRYYWKVWARSDIGEEGESVSAWFETSKMEEPWEADFISPVCEQKQVPVLFQEFHINTEKEFADARLYICGLGIYEVYINQERVGNEYLTPYCNSYDCWLQYQTYEIEGYLRKGKNSIEIWLGDGWYKGKYGYRVRGDFKYGDTYFCIAEVHFPKNEQDSLFLKTDESWGARESKVKYSDIYDGEIYDESFGGQEIYPVKKIEENKLLLQGRRSLPVVIKEKYKPMKVIHTSRNETVLDMGQNMAGWLTYQGEIPAGIKIIFEYGEVLQDGCFYNENLRTAKARYEYISNGGQAFIRPHFTYFGFRYVRVTGMEVKSLEGFWAEVLYTDLEMTGNIKGSEAMVNQLFSNTLWGQKSNFLDVPTDCPQRDERLGWTGDAQIFAGTACYNMNVYAFFEKYLYDMAQEQTLLNGMVPMVVPSVGFRKGTSAAWGDAAVIIPWNLYLHYGSLEILRKQYESMKGWVEYIRREARKAGNEFLWQSGFHYGDWLAADGGPKNMPTGGTEVFYISSAYYYYSTYLFSKALGIIGKDEEALEYMALAENIKTALQNEYFTESGRLAMDTQTAYILAIYMKFIPEGAQESIKKHFFERLKKDHYYLQTGFVGTPYILQALSEIGGDELAYGLLLNKKCPGWLYPITMGATTMWERWDSVLPNGKISDTGMNSLNHYAYGSVVEWMYRYMLGIQPVEEKPGFVSVRFTPRIDPRFAFVKGEIDTVVGKYKVCWEQDGHSLQIKISIPFGAAADIRDLQKVGMLKSISKNEVLLSVEEVLEEVGTGEWTFCYALGNNFAPCYTLDDSMEVLFQNLRVKAIIEEEIPGVEKLSEDIHCQSLKEMSGNPFFLGVGRLNLSPEVLERIELRIKGILKYQ